MSKTENKFHALKILTLLIIVITIIPENKVCYSVYYDGKSFK